MMVDFVAKRYGMLPSELLVRANTFDIMIAETAVGYENYLNKKDRGDTMTPQAPDLSEKEMQAMIDKVKEDESKNK
jgi:hypothetical protein